ncbi:unnamed protein product [Closterium sp. Naga37s-1]|nr:unnamed protein product [Closterium sp. Naga37s-1]
MFQALALTRRNRSLAFSSLRTFRQSTRKTEELAAAASTCHFSPTPFPPPPPLLNLLSLPPLLPAPFVCQQGRQRSWQQLPAHVPDLAEGWKEEGMGREGAKLEFAAAAAASTCSCADGGMGGGTQAPGEEGMRGEVGK